MDTGHPKTRLPHGGGIADLYFAAQIQDRALLEEIESYVSALSPQVQAIFRLRVYGERSFPEIAAALGEKEAAVKTRYYRLMCQLRKEFTPYD